MWLKSGHKVAKSNCGESDKRIVNRYTVVPVLEIGEQHRWNEYEKYNSRYQIQRYLSNQINFAWHIVSVGRHLVCFISSVELNKLLK